jgi:DNA (cytosine-5)-methyltransferase 1
MERKDKVIEKPLYRVPSMVEIESLPWNGYRVASTFSGCGGSCLGYRMAGYRVVYANEFIEEAQRTYKANHQNSFLDTRDIRQVRPEDVMERANVNRGELDLFDGSPPCSAFSTAGKREAGWGKVKSYSDKTQRVDDLFFEYVRLLDGIRPKVFVAENVSGLTKGTAKGYFKRILAALKEPGYRVVCKVLDAQWLGVPQMRQRTIFVGVREDLGIDPVHPVPLPYRYTVGDALEGLPEGGEAKRLKPGTDTYCYWAATKAGHSLSDACMDLTGKNSFLTHVKQSPHRQANTITQGTQQLYHWSEPRTLTLQELRRVGGFPDDFELTGSFSQRWERIGRAVPPLMMAQVAKTIEERILRCVA